MAVGTFGRTILSSDPAARDTDDDEVILRQWCAHTLQTRPGTLRTAPEHGIDLPGMLLQGVTPEALVSIPAMVKAALERGKRVARAKVTATRTNLGGGKVGLHLQIEVTPVKGAAINFTHTVGPDLADQINRGA